MIFYCTTKINDYHKIGISSSLSGVKKRLITYRSAAPGTKIKFFTEVYGAEELERSFKNKFDYQRIGRSECYNLRADIIFSHVLKFIHRDKFENVFKKNKFIKKKIVTDKRLFSVWRNNRYYISNYYLEGGYKGLHFFRFKDQKDLIYDQLYNDDDSYDLTDNQIFRWYMLRSFFPVCEINEDYKLDKKNNIIENSKKFILHYANLDTKEKINELVEKKSLFLNKYYNSGSLLEQKKLFNEFLKKNYKKKKFKEKYLAVNHVINYIYDCIKKNSPSLVKGYKLKEKYNIYGDLRTNAHKSLPWRHKIQSTYKNINLHKFDREHANIISKASYLPLDKLVESIEEIIDTPPNYYLRLNKNREELILQILRILKFNNHKAIKSIKKIIEDFKKKNL